ncbi:MAG: M23 family metallopeptidase [Candidatus Improbicoccus pseudotrichonymphae]|uniref:M23 family metallopeptidase n=1 Tax=Candidatus Improbicoccus pseudotrichonymphae TaxID=3033792 RepID=A0AA48I552_9FIRM|nr:MAG: M23 family metallopeptidase [Candidatus Improbicoccus pseudotrichonymphae]
MFLLNIRIKRNLILIFIPLLISLLFFILKIKDGTIHLKAEKKFIKYLEFNPTFEALRDAMNEDVKSHNENINVISWIDILAYLAAKYGGNFKKYKNIDLKEFVNELKTKKDVNEITKKMKFFPYYREGYSAVLSGFLGYREIKNADGIIEKKYGLLVYSPIPKGFYFNHYDDFGASRNFGYKRVHLGNDLMCLTGVPVVAVEKGRIEIMGWNKYGGWRIGIRSFDEMRYYYYAHLRKNKPFNTKLKIGDFVEAGQVIGYVGRTGYSDKENVNNISKSHLHLGLQIIFDESQKECNNEIWINLYSIVELLEKNKSKVKRDEKTREFFKIN